MADQRKPLRDTNFPFPMGFPTRMLMYVVLDLLIINLLVFYFVEKMPLRLVLPIAVLEIVTIAVAFAFWVSPYKLRW